MAVSIDTESRTPVERGEAGCEDEMLDSGLLSGRAGNCFPAKRSGAIFPNSCIRLVYVLRYKTYQ